MDFWEFFTGKKAGGEKSGNEKRDIKQKAFEQTLGYLMARELMKDGKGKRDKRR